MSRNRQAMGPWEGIQVLLEFPQNNVLPKHHPPCRVLRAYLAGSLPERPMHWTKDRARGLVGGRLSDWTSFEVAAHVSICTRCRAQLTRLEQKKLAFQWNERLNSLRKRMHEPRVAWALAGVQALAIVGLVCWLASTPGPAPKSILPEFPNVTSSALVNSSFTIQLAQLQGNLEELTAFLSGIGVQIQAGPDEAGYYKLHIPVEARQTLEQSPYVVNLKKS